MNNINRFLDIYTLNCFLIGYLYVNYEFLQKRLDYERILKEILFNEAQRIKAIIKRSNKYLI